MNSRTNEKALPLLKSIPQEDVTGRDRIFRNVGVGWISQFIFLVSGFIVPRMIDKTLGQDVLGVWDFGWSLVAYFGLVQIGVVSSINRYVARHRAVGDIEGINTVASSVICVLGVMATIVFGLTLGASASLPYLFGAKLGPFTSEAQWVVFFLGTSLVVQILWSAYGGVLTGCHRWDLHHGVNGGCRLITLGGMVTVLLWGYGLVWLAFVNLVGEVLGLLTRLFMAYRVCPGLRIRSRYIRRSTIRNLLNFGIKTFVPGLGDLLSNQTLSIFVIWFLGPSALALYSRYRSLIRHLRVFIIRYAFTFTPVASALQATEDISQLQDLFIRANRYGALIVLPFMAGIAIFGGPIVRLWMGPNYENQALASIIALGFLPTFLQLPALSILRGLNAHGRPGVAKFIASLVGIFGAWLALGPIKEGIAGAVVALLTPLGLCDGIYLTAFSSGYLQMPIRTYVKQSLFQPVICVLPFVISLVAIRVFWVDIPFVYAFLTMAGSSIILALMYWKFALPKSLKEKLRPKLSQSGLSR